MLQLQQAELERGFAAGIGGRERLEDRFGARVIAARRDAERVVDRNLFVLGKRLRDGFDFVVAPGAEGLLGVGARRGDVLACSAVTRGASPAVKTSASARRDRRRAISFGVYPSAGHGCDRPVSYIRRPAQYNGRQVKNITATNP